MKPDSSIFIAGHRGLVGSTITRSLQKRGFSNLLLRTRQEVDLQNQAAVEDFFQTERPEYVYLAAGLVGGIHANSTQQADFLYQNVIIAANVVHAAARYDCQKLLFLGSSCIYPKLAPQPIREEFLLSSPLEETNEGYAIAKIAGLKLCEYYTKQYGKRFISAMPTNLYGPGDNFHPLNSHVIPGMMRRFHEASVENRPAVVVWGSGRPLREFMHVEDLADALIELMERYEGVQTINVGSGEEVTIAELAEAMKEATGYGGRIEFDASKPDGTPRKALDSARMRSLGWSPRYTLREGLAATYRWAVDSGALAIPEKMHR